MDHDLQQGEVDGTYVLFRGNGLVSRGRPGHAAVSVSPGVPARQVPCLRTISASRALRMQDLLRRIGAILPMDQQGLLRRAALLLEAIALYCDAGRESEPGAIHREAQRLHDIIDRRACEDVPMARLYREVAVSPARAAALFARAFGVSPVAYRTQLRLNRARELLVSTRRNVSEAAYEVGFSDPLYFSRAFHRRFGMTPSSIIRRFSATRRA
jgi:AraC-like DNA-binding protein